ncbi:uncharacterized protein LOC131176484 [Hevea brasiliensis]|uniref:uncharacterized protein LOC131176484 n=1 Tax=Hevea brasiliensis TaxID=3981 RepID=UPI0025D030B0|nr:uncharacterized protein LOC131176484 [Hevea brasiliensis]
MRLLNLRFFPVLRFPLCMKHSHGSFVQRVPNLHSLPVVLLLAVIQMDNRVIEEEVEEELQQSNQRNGEASSNPDSRGVICYYCHEPGHTKYNCPQLQRKNQRSQMANMAAEDSTVSSSEKTVLVSAEDFAQFSQYQASLKPTSSPITAIAESGKSTTCLVSSSSKWVIDSGATDHMTGSYDEADYW